MEQALADRRRDASGAERRIGRYTGICRLPLARAWLMDCAETALRRMENADNERDFELAQREFNLAVARLREGGA